jgi:hypothetical protein
MVQSSAPLLAAEVASLIERETFGDEALIVSQNVRFCHAGPDPASRTYLKHWIPAFAGMTL